MWQCGGEWAVIQETSPTLLRHLEQVQQSYSSFDKSSLHFTKLQTTIFALATTAFKYWDENT